MDNPICILEQLFFLNPKPPTQVNDLSLQKIVFAFINYSILDV